MSSSLELGLVPNPSNQEMYNSIKRHLSKDHSSLDTNKEREENLYKQINNDIPYVTINYDIDSLFSDNNANNNVINNLTN